MRLRAAGPAGRASLSICPLLMQVVLEEQNGSWLYPERLQADSWEQVWGCRGGFQGYGERRCVSLMFVGSFGAARHRIRCSGSKLWSFPGSDQQWRAALAGL